MPRIVIFDELATPQRVLSTPGPSANTADYAGRSDALIDPDLSALVTTSPEGHFVTFIVPSKYWKHEAGAIVSYTAGEIATQDAADAAAQDLGTREGAKEEFVGFNSHSLVMRAFADILKDEFNDVRQWIEAFKAEVAAANNLADLKTRVAGLPAMPDRTLAQIRNQIDIRTDGGTVDIG